MINLFGQEGNGPGDFYYPYDLVVDEGSDNSRAQAEALTHAACHVVLTAAFPGAEIAGCSYATIARVQGAAIGGGCGLMVVPDFAVTHPEVRVGYPEVSLGLCPAVVAPWLHFTSSA